MANKNNRQQLQDYFYVATDSLLVLRYKVTALNINVATYIC